jgi:hypothetical protein
MASHTSRDEAEARDFFISFIDTCEIMDAMAHLERTFDVLPSKGGF